MQILIEIFLYSQGDIVFIILQWFDNFFLFKVVFTYYFAVIWYMFFIQGGVLNQHWKVALVSGSFPVIKNI